MRLDLALILGMIIGGGMLTKTNADFALILLPFSLLLFTFKEKYVYKRLGKWLLYVLVASVIAGVMYSVLRLSPFYHIISDKNYTFIYSPKEWIHNPLAYFSGNFKGLFGWLMTYITVPFFILVIASFFVGKKYIHEKLLLLSWFIVPFIALALFGKVIYPRFMLFMTMPLLVLAAYALYYLMEFSQKIWLKGLVMIVFVLMFIVNDFFILSDFSHANVPESDKNQFLFSWPSGIGVQETVKFLREQSKKSKNLRRYGRDIWAYAICT